MPPLAAFLLLALILAGVGEFVYIFGLHAVVAAVARFGLIFIAAALVRWIVIRSRPGAKG
jgi:hypothetical protein